METPDLTPDQKAAHEFLAELRTRIATQELPYQYGVEESALKSLWLLFDFAREAIKNHPGCDLFAAEVTRMLNVRVRPVTAKWDRANAEGILKSSDGADQFRGDLTALQIHLLGYARTFHAMAYGTHLPHDAGPPVMSGPGIDELFHDLPFGIIPSDLNKIAEQINSDEAKAVAERRKLFKIKTRTDQNAVGLALSGGGIRSATFGLGVVQVLAEKGLLKDVDFLSTVSGGGYTGSFLSRRLGGMNGVDQGVQDSDLAAPQGPDPLPVSHVRQNAKFLVARNLKESWRMVVVTLAGMMLNWTVPLLVMIFAALLVRFSPKPQNPDAFWQWAIATTGGLTLVAVFFFCVMLRQGPKRTGRGERVLGFLSAATALVAIGWLLDIGYGRFSHWHDHKSGAKGLWLGIASMGAVAGPALIRFLPILKTPGVRKIALKILLLTAGLILPLLMVVTFYCLLKFGETPANLWILAGAAVLLGLVNCWALDINLTAPHRLYRNGLASTFVQTCRDEPDLPLTEINLSGRAPYHLINTALNVPASQHPALKDRRCEFFLFSKYWSGSPATGYQTSDLWKAGNRPMDLATAMAISGAAFSSYMGLGSMPSLTALLTLLNIRLGFWIKQPGHRSLLGAHPGFVCLLREMTGIGMSEKDSWLNLSDGGHIENLAVYELLRRRCKFIICVDGEADPAFTFQGLMTVVRHAQIDFGVHIEADLDKIRPDPESGLSGCHYHFCRIHYPAVGNEPDATGLLLYLKLSVTGNESELIKRYRINHPEFPHQTTLDQFFDQEQFEAYRQLGVHVADGLFSSAITSGSTSPPTVRSWFESLARNLLQPSTADRQAICKPHTSTGLPIVG
jgi:hypothetical protein